MDDVLCEDEKDFIDVLQIIEKGIKAENREIEQENEDLDSEKIKRRKPIPPIRIKQKKGDPRFEKIRKLVMRDLAEGKRGWITKADDSDTEVDIDMYFKGNLAP
eukprot:89894_1